MSDQEKKSGTTCAEVPVVMVEQNADSRQKLYRPAEMKEGQDLPNIRSRAPAVPLAARTSEELKNATNERRESEAALASDKQERNVTKKFSNKRRNPSPESIHLTPLEVETKGEEKSGRQLQIPAQVELAAAASRASNLSDKIEPEKKDDEDSITEDIGELKTTKADTKHSEWSYEEEAGGLPRSDSRASRVSRAMQQLFCCGVRYEAPSEHNVSAREGYYASGI